MKRLLILCLLALQLFMPLSARAATGCNYPTTLDSWPDKGTGDFLTVADVNQRTCAIEKLESGPLQPNLGSSTAPAYSFTGDSNTGIYSSAGGSVDIAGDTIRIASFSAVASGVNYFHFSPAATGNPITIAAEGSDTNVAIAYDTKGTGAHIWRRAAGATEDMRLASGILTVGHSVTTSSAAGDIVLKNNSGLRGVNGAGSSTVLAIGIDTSNRVRLGNGAGDILIDSGTGVVAVNTTVTTGSAAGDIIVKNNIGLRGVNAAGSNTVVMIGVNASDQVQLSDGSADIKWNNPVVALGGGSSATLGTIGGSGPTAAAQASWVRVITSTGAAGWMALWQ